MNTIKPRRSFGNELLFTKDSVAHGKTPIDRLFRAFCVKHEMTYTKLKNLYVAYALSCGLSRRDASVAFNNALKTIYEEKNGTTLNYFRKMLVLLLKGDFEVFSVRIRYDDGTVEELSTSDFDVLKPKLNNLREAFLEALNDNEEEEDNEVHWYSAGEF